MKKFVKRLFVGALVLSSFAGSVALTQEVHAEEEYTVEAIAKGFTQQYWSAVRSGAEAAAEEYNVNLTFQGPANETAVQEQVQMLSNSINKQPDAIALASLDVNSQVDLLQSAKDQGIPIIGFDSGVPGAPEGSVLATAQTDNIAAAGIAAEEIYAAIKEVVNAATVEEPIRIGVLSQEANSTSITERTQGFSEKMLELIEAGNADLAGKVAIVGHEKFANDVNEKEAAVVIQVQIPANATDSEVLTASQALLNQPNIKAVFASNETCSKGLINANDALGNILGTEEGKIIAAGFDSGTLQKQAISSGMFLGSVTQDPITIGYTAVELAVKSVKGEEVEDLSVDAVWYNAENMESEEIAPLLYD